MLPKIPKEERQVRRERPPLKKADRRYQLKPTGKTSPAPTPLATEAAQSPQPRSEWRRKGKPDESPKYVATEARHRAAIIHTPLVTPPPAQPSSSLPSKFRAAANNFYKVLRPTTQYMPGNDPREFKKHREEAATHRNDVKGAFNDFAIAVSELDGSARDEAWTYLGDTLPEGDELVRKFGDIEILERTTKFESATMERLERLVEAARSKRDAHLSKSVWGEPIASPRSPSATTSPIGQQRRGAKPRHERVADIDRPVPASPPDTPQPVARKLPLTPPQREREAVTEAIDEALLSLSSPHVDLTEDSAVYADIEKILTYISPDGIHSHDNALIVLAALATSLSTLSLDQKAALMGVATGAMWFEDSVPDALSQFSRYLKSAVDKDKTANEAPKTSSIRASGPSPTVASRPIPIEVTENLDIIFGSIAPSADDETAFIDDIHTFEERVSVILEYARSNEDAEQNANIDQIDWLLRYMMSGREEASLRAYVAGVELFRAFAPETLIEFNALLIKALSKSE